MKHRYHLILTLLLLPVQILCLAQNSQFQFEILDTSNFEPISFSTLSWGQNEGTISDDLGFARLIANLEHSDTIYISCIGFSTAKIPIHELSSSSLNKIYLSRASFELSDITITAHKKRIQNSRKIIKTAISSIEKNYPLDTLVYNGYYREYTKNNSDYINVFESIIDLQDPGFFNEDSFQTSVLFKRANNSFTIDSFLLIPYDNLNKFVPFSTMGVKQNNELLILRTHDPIRNYKANSFDFIGQFQKDFVANHTFSKPKITYLDNTPYYYIDFKDNVGFVYQDEVRIQAEGYIYINAEDYGIKKLSYRVNLDNYIINSKLFEVNVEYKKQADKYYLNYISFNNLFRYKEIQLTNQVIDTISNCFTLYFNRELNSEMASDLKNYQAYQGGEKLLLTNIKAKKNQACLWVSNKQHLSGQTLDLNIAYLDDTHKLNFERDDKKSYYQYREFFVKETKLNDRLHENLLDYNRSVFHNEPFVVLPNIDTSWINTPLINEEVETSMLTAENRKILESAASLYKLNSLKQNEITYIQADREVYAPGDTIWLKAYIQSRENLKPSNKSDLFFLELLNESGEIVDNSKFLVSESASKAQIVLDQNLQDGYYYLLAYSSWMKNFAPEDLYRKKILVKNSQQNNPEFIPVLNKSSFFPGDTVQLSVRCIDNVNREANNVPYSYEIRSGNSVLHQGNELASNSDKTNIVFTIPINETKSLNYRIEGKYQGETLITSQTINVINKVHIDFFPEGGHCINSQAINIAFKALTNTGEPIDIKGRIIDDKGEKIMDVSTLHDGMGKFSLTPIKAQNFYLELTEPSVFSDIFPLPAAEQDGWNLSANYEDSKLIVDVRKTDRHEKPALLTLKIRDHLYYHKLINVKNEGQVQIHTNEFPIGVGVLTLIDDEMKPCAERLVFVNHEKANEILMQTGANNYTPRDSVHLKIRVSTPDGNPVKGSYSLSVFDHVLGSSPGIEENNIASSLMLSSEIKGNIYNPNYYSNFKDDEVMANLDLLLLCQGWRDYNYLNELAEIDSISLPVDQDIISGQVRKLSESRKPVPIMARVSVFYGMQTTDIVTDENGMFSFKFEYNSINSPNFSIYANAINGRSDIELVLDSSYFEQQLKDIIPTLISRQRLSDEPKLIYKKFEEDFSIELKNHIWLEEVSVTSYFSKQRDREGIASMLIGAKSARKNDLENSMELYDVLLNMGLNVDMGESSCDEQIYQVVKTWVDGEKVDLHWYVNGVFNICCSDNYSKYAFDYSYVSHISPDEVDRLTFVKGIEAKMYDNDFEAVVDVKYSPKLFKQANGLNKVDIKNAKVYKEFYSPKYEIPGQYQTIPDLRKTIHWEPNLTLDEKGEATIVFYNADRYSRIKCVLEGISSEGIPSHQEIHYDVTLLK